MSVPREAIVAEALAWQGTPFHHAARVRGAGVDCANLLAGVYHAVGLVPDLDLGYYPRDWHLNRSAERFLEWLDLYGERTEEALPGDIAAFKFGRCVSHAGIVLAWPVVIHAWAKSRQVERADAGREPLAGRLHGFYRVKGV